MMMFPNSKKDEEAGSDPKEKRGSSMRSRFHSAGAASVTSIPISDPPNPERMVLDEETGIFGSKEEAFIGGNVGTHDAQIGEGSGNHPNEDQVMPGAVAVFPSGGPQEPSLNRYDSATQQQSAAQSDPNDPPNDIVATAFLVEDGRDQQQVIINRNVQGDPPGTENGSSDVFATAKRVSPAIGFAQDHLFLVLLVSLAIVGGVAGVTVYFARRDPRPSPTPIPTPTLIPTADWSNETCEMDPNDRASEIKELIRGLYYNDGNPPAVLLNNLGTPQGKALEWLTKTDNRTLCPDDPSLFQRFGLALLYFALDGKNWRFDSSEIPFLSDADECEWAGILYQEKYGTNYTVTGINMGGRQLTGKILKEMFSIFTQLTELIMPDNNLDSVSGDITNLSELRVLDLSNNRRLTKTILVDIDKLYKLEYLKLSKLSIDGSLPSNLFKLKQLKVLRLDGNQIEGEVNSAIGGLEALESIDVSANLLQGALPEGMFFLPKLTDLHLADNNFEGQINPSIGHLQNLSYLDLSNNLVTGELPEDLFALSKLHMLRLEKNRISGTLSSSISHLSGLEELSLWKNELRGELPASLVDLRNLKRLFLNNNGFLGALPGNLGNLERLQFARFDDNEFESTIPGSIISLTHLEKFMVHRNKIIGNVSDEICSFVLSDDPLGRERVLKATCGDSCPWQWDATCPENVRFDSDRGNKILAFSCPCCVCEGYDEFGAKGDWSYSDDMEFCYSVGRSQHMQDDQQSREEFVLEVINSFFNASAILEDAKSPQAKAMSWLINNDKRLFNETSLFQRYALAVLYFATNGDDWKFCSANKVSDCTVGKGFLSPASECEWGGIQCEDGEVHAIDMDDNGLKGTLPLEELHCFFLERLSLRGNVGLVLNSTTTLPESLRYLDLSHNGMVGTISDRMLPYSSRMEELYLNNNFLKGTIPEIVSESPSMKILWLNDNDLTGGFPPLYSSARPQENELIDIRIDNNALSGSIPDSIEVPVNLESISFHNNDLTGTVPETICDLMFENGGLIEEMSADCGLGEIQCDCCTRCFN